MWTDEGFEQAGSVRPTFKRKIVVEVEVEVATYEHPDIDSPYDPTPMLSDDFIEAIERLCDDWTMAGDYPVRIARSMTRVEEITEDSQFRKATRD